MSIDVDEEIVKTFLTDCKVLKSSITGFLDSNNQDDFLNSLKACGFSFYKRTSIFYETSKRYKSSKIRFSYGTKIPFFGYPFMINKTIYMRCSQDGDYKPSAEKNTSQMDRKHIHNISHIQIVNPRKRTVLQSTKKMGCKAFLNITYIIVFRHFEVKNLQTEKREAAEKIKKNLEEFVKGSETRLLVELSSTKEHNHPPTTQDQIIHSSLKSEIYKMVANDITSASTIKPHLFKMVEKMISDNKIPKPDQNNHCFYPPREVIRYHINMAKFSLQKENFDEIALSELINKWKIQCDDQFHLQPSSTLSSALIKTTPLFCHQTKWQQYLLNVYGNSITILDAIHKSTNYTFPVYFLIVKTNKSFIPVGTFILRVPHEYAIFQALNLLSHWNPTWNPKYFVCGHEDAERNAVLSVFPNCAQSICSYRTYHLWKSWLNQNKAGNDLLNLWEALMYSKTEDEFIQNETLMQNHSSYKTNVAVETYFYKIWYPLREKWVIAYQTQEFYVYINLNGGTENGKEFFRFKFFNEREEKILSSVVTLIVIDYLPECFQEYYSYNVSNGLGSQNLINRPIDFINHFTERFKRAESEFAAPTIISTDANKFMLKSGSHEDWYHVDFEEVNCTCDDFQKWRYPCIHMCSVFKFTALTIDNLAGWYLNSPYLKSDQRIAKFSGHLPDWYRDKRSENNGVSNEEPRKKRMILDEIMEPETFVENEIESDVHALDPEFQFPVYDSIQNQNEKSTPDLERFRFLICDPIQNKKSSIQNLLKCLSQKVEDMAENELNICYERLKSLQDEIAISELLV